MSIWDKSQNFAGMTGKEGCFSPHEEQDVEAAKKFVPSLIFLTMLLTAPRNIKNRLIQFQIGIFGRKNTESLRFYAMQPLNLQLFPALPKLWDWNLINLQPGIMPD